MHKTQDNKQEEEPTLSKPAQKFMSSQDAATRAALQKAIAEIPDGDVKLITGTKGLQRLRKGKFRIVFYWITDTRIYVEKIGTRGGAYKGK